MPFPDGVAERRHKDPPARVETNIRVTAAAHVSATLRALQDRTYHGVKRRAARPGSEHGRTDGSALRDAETRRPRTEVGKRGVKGYLRRKLRVAPRRQPCP